MCYIYSPSDDATRNSSVFLKQSKKSLAKTARYNKVTVSRIFLYLFLFGVEERDADATVVSALAVSTPRLVPSSRRCNPHLLNPPLRASSSAANARRRE